MNQNYFIGILAAIIIIGGGVWLFASGGLNSGTVTAPAPTVTPVAVAASTTTPYIKSAQISSSIGGSQPDLQILYVYGTGFDSSYRVYINEVNGLGTVLMPVSKYAVDNGSNGTSITVVIPNNIDSTKQYNVYISNGNTTSNVVTTPSHG